MPKEEIQMDHQRDGCSELSRDWKIENGHEEPSAYEISSEKEKRDIRKKKKYIKRVKGQLGSKDIHY